MRAMRQPTRFTLDKATELGRMMAQSEPRLVPTLANAHEFTGYVQFLQAHRHRLEQQPAFHPWDTRLTALIESEGKMLGFVLSDRDEYDELLISIAAPIRAAFWYGWETIHNVKPQYDQLVQQAKAKNSEMQVLQVRNAPEAPKVTRRQVLDESDAFWDNVASSMLSSLDNTRGESSGTLSH